MGNLHQPGRDKKGEEMPQKQQENIKIAPCVLCLFPEQFQSYCRYKNQPLNEPVKSARMKGDCCFRIIRLKIRGEKL